METVGLFYGHLEHISVIWYILWSFGNLVYFHPFLVCQEKSGNPDLPTLLLSNIVHIIIGCVIMKYSDKEKIRRASR
jgi:uncharacterized membrane protein